MDSEYYHQDAGPVKKPKKKRGWFRKFFSNFTRIFKSDKTRPAPTRTQSFHTRNPAPASGSQTPNSTSNFNRNGPQTRSMPNIRQQNKNRQKSSPPQQHSFVQDRNGNTAIQSVANGQITSNSVFIPENGQNHTQISSIKPANSIKSPSFQGSSKNHGQRRPDFTQPPPSHHPLQNNTAPPTHFLSQNQNNIGVAGFYNHGNTCFMNAILQAIVSTDIFAEFMVKELYKPFLRQQLADSKQQRRREVTDSFANLIKTVWTGDYSPNITKELKYKIGELNTDYNGTVQHDAHEFLTWILDQLDEDLKHVDARIRAERKSFNGVTRNGSTKSSGPNGVKNSLKSGSKTDFNPQSKIEEIFCGEFKTSMTKADGGQNTGKKHSDNRYEPFKVIQLPLASENSENSLRPLCINCLVQMTDGAKLVKHGFKLTQNARGKTLKRELVTRLNLHQRGTLLHLIEVSGSGIVRSVLDENHLLLDNVENQLLAIEHVMPRAFDVKKFMNSTISSPNSSRINYSAINPSEIFCVCFSTISYGSSFVRLPTTIVFFIQPNATCSQICNKYIDQMLLQTQIPTLPENYKSFMKLKIHNESTGITTYIDMADYVMPFIEFSVGQTAVQDNVVKLIFEYENSSLQKNSIDLTALQMIKFEDDATALNEEKCKQNMRSTPISDCFQTFFEPEILEIEDKNETGEIHTKIIKKTMKLHNLPEVLIVALNRFHNDFRTGKMWKLHNRIDFPVTGLDVSDWLSGNSSSEDVDRLYDLYAVVNHHGSMTSGHYTATCRNSFDRKWRKFDDEKFSELGGDDIDAARVVTKDSYLLFYQKRKPGCKKAYNNEKTHWLLKTEESYPEKQQATASSHVVRNSKQYSSMPNRRRQQVKPNQANSVKSRPIYNEY